MDPDEFINWQVWRDIRGPFGVQRDDFRMGILCSLIDNLADNYREHPNKATPQAFMLFDTPEQKRVEDVEKTKTMVGFLGQIVGMQPR